MRVRATRSEPSVELIVALVLIVTIFAVLPEVSGLYWSSGLDVSYVVDLFVLFG